MSKKDHDSEWFVSPLLTRRAVRLEPEEEARLLRVAQQGDADMTRDVVERILLSHLLHIIHVARRYRRSGIALEDLVQDGAYALIRDAIRKYDPKKAKFTTYSQFWLRRQFQEHLRKNRDPVCYPNRFNLQIQAAWRCSRRLEKQLGRAPTDREILTALRRDAQFRTNADVRSFKWILMWYLDKHHIQLDRPIGDESDGRTKHGSMDMVPDAIFTDDMVDIRMRAGRLTTAILRMVKGLKGRHKTVIIRRFGLDARTPETLDAIGKRFGVTRERVRQIQEAALRQLCISFAEEYDIRLTPAKMGDAVCAVGECVMRAKDASRST